MIKPYDTLQYGGVVTREALTELLFPSCPFLPPFFPKRLSLQRIIATGAHADYAVFPVSAVPYNLIGPLQRVWSPGT